MTISESLRELPPESLATVAPRSARRGWTQLTDAGWFLLSILLILAAWQLAVVWAGLPEVVLPAPLDVWQEIVDRREVLFTQGMSTTLDILAGFAISLLVGVPIAVAIAFSRIVERLVYPLLVVSQAIPKVAIAPLLLIWFGFGSTTNILLAVSVAVFPIIVNLALGLTEIDEDLVRLGRVMGGSKLRLFVKVRFPSALPNLLAGMKLAVTFAAIGTVVGEFFAGNSGLGYLAQAGAGALNTELTFAAIVVLSVLSVVLFYAVALFEAVLLRHRPRAR